jgi:hypothetical protein
LSRNIENTSKKSEDTFKMIPFSKGIKCRQS